MCVLRRASVYSLLVEPAPLLSPERRPYPRARRPGADYPPGYQRRVGPCPGDLGRPPHAAF